MASALFMRLDNSMRRKYIEETMGMEKSKSKWELYKKNEENQSGTKQK